MNPCVIALSGRMGAGKSTIATAISECLGWPLVSFGDYVREIAREQETQESRATLQELGESLVQSDPLGFTRAVISKVNLSSGAVVDGVRHMEILHALQSLADPLRVQLIYVEIDEQLRIQRLTKLGMTADEIRKADSHSTEVQVNGVLRDIAALYTRGDGDTTKTVVLILEWLKDQEHR